MTRIIDLRGPEGNVFALMSNAQQWGKQLGLDTDAILADMQSSDYNHALAVFEEHFQHVATLVNKPDEYDEDDEDDE